MLIAIDETHEIDRLTGRVVGGLYERLAARDGSHFQVRSRAPEGLEDAPGEYDVQVVVEEGDDTWIFTFQSWHLREVPVAVWVARMHEYVLASRGGVEIARREWVVPEMCA